MPPSLNADTTETKARELLDKRISSVRALVTTRQAIHDLREQLARAEAEDVKAYRAALADGWTADELRDLGIDEPEKKQRARRRAASKKSSTPINPFTPRDELVEMAAQAARDAEQRAANPAADD